MYGIQLVLFGMQNRTFGPYLAAVHNVLNPSDVRFVKSQGMAERQASHACLSNPSLGLAIRLPACPALPVRLSVCLSVHVSLGPSVLPSFRPSVLPSDRPSVSQTPACPPILCSRRRPFRRHP
jgi:hypothetical protein